jgi:lysophospholipid acyltransferase (LPLAT)-like uncharacterized protein
MLNWLMLNVLPLFGAGIIRLLGRTMRIRTEGADRVDALHQRGQPIILTFWHAQQLMIPLGYRGAGTHILISRHRDGEVIARIIARFGHRSVRGSSTRGGAWALRELIRLGRSGADLVVTPDGPKGPRQVAKIGVVQLARATGLPIVPLAFSCSKKNSSRAGIGSWSRIRSAVVCSTGANRSGCRVMRPSRSWKPSGASWRRS